MVTILDWRPLHVRLGTGLWGNSDSWPGGEVPGARPSRPPLSWVEKIHARFMESRAAGREDPPESLFVVSVGNLALGGTGKTPVTLALAQDLAARGLQGAVLTRGFGSRLAGPLFVKADNGLAGDEARLMAQGLAGSGWPVVQSRNRAVGLAHIQGELPYLDLVIAEDAHQTARLGRHLDVLILHRWRREEGRVEPAPGPVVPFGPWRESAAGAYRAGVWVIESESGEATPHRGKDEPRVATFSRSMVLKTPSGGGGDPGPGTRWASLAGIARPERFEAGVRAIRGEDPVLAIRPGDHADYGPRMVRRILRALDGAEAGLLVTTAKDWIKLEALWDRTRPVLVADLEVSWGNDGTLPELVGERLDAWKNSAAR